MRRTRLEQRVLLTLLHGPQHGYGIVCALQEGVRSVVLGPGRLYRVIDKLVHAGLIRECQPGSDGARRYRISEAAEASVLDAATSGAPSPATEWPAVLRLAIACVEWCALHIVRQLRGESRALTSSNKDP